MVVISRQPKFYVGTYNNGQPYQPARGRNAPRTQVEDRLRPSHAVVDLDREVPTAGDFSYRVLREMKIRFYQPSTLRNYRKSLTGLLRWFGNRPHLISKRGCSVLS